MVFEEIYSVGFLSKRPYAAALMGFAYALVGMAVALFTFQDDPAIIAVAIASVLFIPSLQKVIAAEEKKEGAKFWKSITKNHSALTIYLFAFIGMFAAFAFFSLMLPQMAGNHLFRQQIEVLTGPTGQAMAFSTGLFSDFIRNNLLVMLLCFIVSVIAGNGSIFFIAWNASVWGTIFGTMAKSSAVILSGNPFILLIIILSSVVPHMLLEITSYILAAISGTQLSDAIIKMKITSAKFSRTAKTVLLTLCLAIIVLAIAAALETAIFSTFSAYSTLMRISFG